MRPTTHHAFEPARYWAGARNERAARLCSYGYTGVGASGGTPAWMVLFLFASVALVAVGVYLSASLASYPEVMAGAKEIFLNLFVGMAGAMPAYRITRPNPHLWRW